MHVHYIMVLVAEDILGRGGGGGGGGKKNSSFFGGQFSLPALGSFPKRDLLN